MTIELDVFIKYLVYFIIGLGGVILGIVGLIRYYRGSNPRDSWDGNERRAKPNTMTIDQETLIRVIKAFEEHTRLGAEHNTVIRDLVTEMKKHNDLEISNNNLLQKLAEARS